jgi:hypothetical protein
LGLAADGFFAAFPLGPALSALAPLLAMPTRALSPASAPTTAPSFTASVLPLLHTYIHIIYMYIHIYIYTRGIINFILPYFSGADLSEIETDLLQGHNM